MIVSRRLIRKRLQLRIDAEINLGSLETFFSHSPLPNYKVDGSNLMQLLDVKSRAAFLVGLVGQPWKWQAGNCWDLACSVQRELFGRHLPTVPVPAEVSKHWIAGEFDTHPERGNWIVVPDGPGGLVLAADGAMVLMAHRCFPSHIGVWLRPEGRIIHAAEITGVAFETPLALRQTGWSKLIYLEARS